jgi:REP element-mobilizing transposase RayT
MHKAIGIYVHITWHTWRRRPWVRRDDVRRIAGAILDAAARTGIHVHAQAVLADHVHVLVSINPAMPLTSFIRHAKSDAARLANLARSRGEAVRWARGYFAGSVSRSHVRAVRIYIGNQHRRHPDLIPG